MYFGHRTTNTVINSVQIDYLKYVLRAFITVAQKGHTCKLKMLLQIKNSTCKLKIVRAN